MDREEIIEPGRSERWYLLHKAKVVHGCSADVHNVRDTARWNWMSLMLDMNSLTSHTTTLRNGCQSHAPLWRFWFVVKPRPFVKIGSTGQSETYPALGPCQEFWEFQKFKLAANRKTFSKTWNTWRKIRTNDFWGAWSFSATNSSFLGYLSTFIKSHTASNEKQRWLWMSMQGFWQSSFLARAVIAQSV
jgi:hypothetical protein